MSQQIHLLGLPAISDNGQPSDLLRNAKGCALLAYLIVRGRSETREHLADLFWDSPDTASGLRNLRVLLTRVRPHLPGLETTRSSVQDIPQPDEAIGYLTLSENLTAGSSRMFLDQPRLYRGELLEGFFLEDAPRYMEWLTLERERLRRAVLNAHRSLCQALAEEKRWQKGAEAAAHWLAIDEVETVMLRTIYVLFFIELGTHRVHIAGCTKNPDSAWIAQQARNQVWNLSDREQPVRYLIRDRDSKFTSSFDSVFTSDGRKIVLTPPKAPRGKSIVEHWIRSVRNESLDHILIFNETHLISVVREYTDYYNERRPHQSLDQRIPLIPATPSDDKGPIRCRNVLGGVIRDYYRLAA